MRHLALLSALAGGLLLAGCASLSDISDVDAITAAATPTGGTAFSRALFDGYKVETAAQAAESDWLNAAIFARKGLAAAKGQQVGPERLSDWEIPADRVGELAGARALLVADLTGGAGERVPAIAGKAQTKFDCWVEEESEGDTTSTCHSEFLALEPQLKAPVVAAAAPAPAPKIVRTFIVYFGFNKATITAAGRKTLDEAAAAQAELKPASIYVSGYTDTVGTSGYNKTLSEKRATAVTNALANLGVKSSTFDVKSFGKDKLAVPTADNVKEARNRRVEIYFEK